ncbi:MAG: HdeD family acid-resistance protein [Acidimicrobiia bacterium]|nr:HdeD family acid-resistance protein [Acidimicrobiia bacterium]
MTSSTSDQPLDAIDLAVARSWPSVMLIGIITIVLGIIVVSWPSQTLTVLSILFGIQLVVFGVYRLIAAFSSEALAPGLSGFIGVISLIAGVVVLRHPFETVTVLAVVLGVVWIVGGAIDLVAAIADRQLRNRGWAALMAIISIIAGIVVVSWPEPTVTVVAWIGGIYLIVFGIFVCIESLSLRKAVN